MTQDDLPLTITLAFISGAEPATTKTQINNHFYVEKDYLT